MDTKIMHKQLRGLSVGISLVLAAGALSTHVMAQDKLPPGVFATVNGQPLSDALLNVNVQANVAEGRVDNEQLREVIRGELVGREVLAQEAKKLKLDQTPEAQARMAQLQQNFMANLLLTNYSATNPVSAEQIKAEYDAFLKNVEGAKQYKLSLIAVPTEARAKEIIAEVNASKDKSLFGEIAAKESTDASKEAQGELDWLLPEQMLPAVGNVVANLTQGKVSAVPIETRGGWNVVRVDDVRDFTPPKQEEIENQLREAATQKQLSAYIQKLQSEAKIVQ
ncbi:MAG: peptidylprolyl isomerase [Orrella sp.]